MRMHILRIGTFPLFILFFLWFSLGMQTAYAEPLHGIYLTQSSVEDTKLLEYFIARAKTSGINTFIMDLERPSKRYRDNVALVKQHGIHYIARIIMFPDGGGTRDLVRSRDYWEKRYKLAKQAVDWGAEEIQLDYIRYKSSQHASKQNAQDVLNVIQFFQNRLQAQNIPLQIDVFGIASYGESPHIGQNIVLFAKSVNAICPMVYPSHYVPFKEHFANPYGTVFESLVRIKAMFKNNPPFQVYAWIELSNYHYLMNKSRKQQYITAQLKAVENAGIHGWFAWSPNNLYDNLFNLLEREKTSSAKNNPAEGQPPRPLQQALEEQLIYPLSCRLTAAPIKIG